MSQSASSSRSVSVTEQVLLGLLFLAGVAILSLPAARSVSGIFGAMPLWLLGLPGASLAAVYLSRRMAGAAGPGVETAARGVRRRQRPQAVATPRRGGGAVRRLRRPRAA